MTSDLEHEGRRLTELLAGKIVKTVRRHRGTEVMLEFIDGTGVFVDKASNALEISVNGGAESD
jgi:hypothetical protein